jgi:hypothetical protein
MIYVISEIAYKEFKGKFNFFHGKSLSGFIRFFENKVYNDIKNYELEEYYLNNILVG